MPFCVGLTGTSRMFCALVLAAGVALRRYAVRGEGLRNVGCRLDYWAVTIDAVKAHDGGVIDEPPAPAAAARPWRSFTPKGVFGTLIELVRE